MDCLASHPRGQDRVLHGELLFNALPHGLGAIKCQVEPLGGQNSRTSRSRLCDPGNASMGGIKGGSRRVFDTPSTTERGRLGDIFFALWARWVHHHGTLRVLAGQEAVQ